MIPADCSLLRAPLGPAPVFIFHEVPVSPPGFRLPARRPDLVPTGHQNRSKAKRVLLARSNSLQTNTEAGKESIAPLAGKLAVEQWIYGTGVIYWLI